MDRGAWWATVHGVAKSRTRLSDFTFTFTSLSLRLRAGLPGNTRVITRLELAVPTLTSWMGERGWRLIPLPVVNILINPAYVTKSL